MCSTKDCGLFLLFFVILTFKLHAAEITIDPDSRFPPYEALLYCRSEDIDFSTCNCGVNGALRERQSLIERYCNAPCPNKCIMGDCDNGYCICQPGFKLAVGSGHECVPFCNKPCVHGVCLAPDECHCNEGYELQNGYECVPICRKGCLNGNCTVPNVCECHDDYFRLNDHVCSPVCGIVDIDGFKTKRDGCIDGTCVSPNKCLCSEGFILKTDKFTCVKANFWNTNSEIIVFLLVLLAGSISIASFILLVIRRYLKKYISREEDIEMLFDS